MKTYPLLVFSIIFSLNINSQTQDYAKAQYLSTYYLGGQRCGDNDSWLHGACHTTDGQAVNKDLTGGWHDCGDYIKFHVTSGYTALTYLYAYDKFPETYLDLYSPKMSAPPSNEIPDVLDEVKFQTDYLIRCVDGSTIYWEVGGKNDHNSFNEPVTNSEQKLYDDSNIRPVRSATEGHSNAFGDAAAALALMSILYEQYDSEYAQSCLTAAQAYYTTGQINQSATADYDVFAYEFLMNTESDDNMGMAAVMLYRATGTASYLTEAKNYASDLPAWENFTYYSLHPILFLELYQISKNTTYLDNIKNLVSGFKNESCGYFHNVNWGSLIDAGNAALIAALYHQETSDETAYNFAKRNVDFILGDHGAILPDAPANSSFLIGYDELGGGYPQYPHNAAAFGKTTSDVWDLYSMEKTNPGTIPFEYELVGGLAGGPGSPCGDFADNIDDFMSGEYCGYYNAAFTGAVAYINKIENNILAVNQTEFEDELIMYPNPSNKFTTIRGNISGKKITVYNTLGKIMNQFSPTENRLTIQTENYSTGVFFLKIKGTQNSKTLKLVKH